ncbi:MAG: hypothetical protein WD066_11055 [Planctomycetaceae bacterium]
MLRRFPAAGVPAAFLVWSVLFAPPASMADETTALGKLAASLEPGEWGELQTENLDLKVFSDGGHHALQYTDEAVWNPITREFVFSGQGHGGGNRFVKYSEATNRWTRLEIPAEYDAERRSGWGFVHAYDHQALDPATGTYFRACYGRTDIRAWDKDGNWRLVTDIPDRLRVKGHITRGFEYFPDMNGLVVFLSGDGLHLYDLEKKEWRTLADKLGTYAYHEIARYNPVHKVVVFGGGNDSQGYSSKNLWKLDAEGNVKPLEDAPFTVGVTHTIFTVDPISGKYLVFNRRGEFFEYDVTADEWKKLTEDKPPLATVGSDLRASAIFGGVAAPVGTHGVVMFVKYGGDDSKVLVYRHSASPAK